jgi:hypothetical protein
MAVVNAKVELFSRPAFQVMTYERTIRRDQG